MATAKARSFWAFSEKYAKYPWNKCISDCKSRDKNASDEKCKKICGSIKAKSQGHEINYLIMAKDLVNRGKFVTMAKYLSAEVVAKIILNPYDSFSECVHDQMNKHNSTKANAIKRCKAFAAKGIHGGIPSKKSCGCD